MLQAVLVFKIKTIYMNVRVPARAGPKGLFQIGWAFVQIKKNQIV
jgi:hypothetical protein